MPPSLPPKAASPAAAPAAQDEEQRRHAAQLRLWQRLQRASHDIIYITLLRAGGEPFGAPFERGLPSLTARLVRAFKQRSFFAFNSSERLGGPQRRNKFTRYGAATYRGPHRSLTPAAPAPATAIQRLLGFWRRRRPSRPS